MVVGGMIMLNLVAMNTPTEGAKAENTVANSRGCNGREKSMVKKDEAMGDIL